MKSYSSPALRLYGARELPYINYKIRSASYRHEDEEVLIPSGFFESFDVHSDIGKAVIIAHEVGHHVQNLTQHLLTDKKALIEEFLMRHVNTLHNNRSEIASTLGLYQVRRFLNKVNLLTK